jgi:methionyl-tRNA formyltransferase
MDYRVPPEADRFRIAIVTQEDPFYIPIFFRELYRLLASSPTDLRPAVPIEIRGVMIQRPLGNRTAGGLAKRIWRLYGTIGFVITGGRYLWRKALRLLGPLAPTVSAYSRRASVPVLEFEPETPGGQPNDANGRGFIEWLRQEKVDLVVSVSASQIFRAAVLATPPLGCINLHNAPLPHYRGMLPNFWQLYHGEMQSVLTIHRMVEDLDKGDILVQAPTPIGPRTTLEQLMRLTKRRSAAVLWTTLVEMTRGGVETRPLPDEEGSYFTWPTREEARELRRRGRRVL